MVNTDLILRHTSSLAHQLERGWSVLKINQEESVTISDDSVSETEIPSP